MADYGLAVAAARDLDDIFDYGASQWGVDQAVGYVTSLATKFALLAEFPEIGSQRLDIAPGIRSTPHGSHVIYFSSDAERLIIQRVLHQRRVPKGHV